MCPTSDHRIETCDQGGLVSASMLSDDLLESLRMSLNSFLTGFDEGFESQFPSAYVFASMSFSSLELTYVEAQEIETHLSVVRCQSVGDSGFAGFQFW